MRRFALIGHPLGHSFSKQYFQSKFREKAIAATYDNIEIDDLTNIREVIEKKNIIGFNVTTPHKQSILDFLDDLSPEAESVGAINCVRVIDGSWIGHNTDVYGFNETLSGHQLSNNPKAMILGNGGASQAVQYALDSKDIPYEVISRSGDLTYDEVTAQMVQRADLIIQCTTLGTHPNINTAPSIPYEAINNDHTCIDLVYNPTETLFLQKCKARGAAVQNGLTMLHAQAERSWEIWNQ